MTAKTIFAVAGLVLSGLWTPAAQAKVTEIFTISDFVSTQPGGSFTVMTSVIGSFTEGTTPADFTSDVVVKEAGFGSATYNLSGPENGAGWTDLPSQLPFPFAATATFRLGSFGAGVSTGVSVSLVDGVFDNSGTVTITETSVMSTPEPSTWAMMLIGFAGLGFAGWRGAGRRTRLAWRGSSQPQGDELARRTASVIVALP
jgi:hypothetical protein